jgi:sugar lactone lactonase YvrE
MTHKIITAGEPLIRCQTSLGEGPVWDQRTQTLYFVDINKSDIHTYVPKTGEHSKQNYGGPRVSDSLSHVGQADMTLPLTSVC